MLLVQRLGHRFRSGKNGLIFGERCRNWGLRLGGFFRHHFGCMFLSWRRLRLRLGKSLILGN